MFLEAKTGSTLLSLFARLSINLQIQSSVISPPGWVRCTEIHGTNSTTFSGLFFGSFYIIHVNIRIMSIFVHSAIQSIRIKNLLSTNLHFNKQLQPQSLYEVKWRNQTFILLLSDIKLQNNDCTETDIQIGRDSNIRVRIYLFSNCLPDMTWLYYSIQWFSSNLCYMGSYPQLEYLMGLLG